MKREVKKLELSNCKIKAAGAEGALEFEGYASVFGGVDSYNDTILKGAYAGVLQRAKRPHMFYNHRYWEMPIGKWLELEEDESGLKVKGEFTPGHSVAADVYAAVKHGTIDGLSIGYALTKDDYYIDPNGVRVIKNISELYEISVVTMPADSAARVTLDSVKSELDTIKSLSDAEKILRDAGGFSRHAATAFVSGIKSLLACEKPNSAVDEEAINRLKKALDNMRLKV